MKIPRIAIIGGHLISPLFERAMVKNTIPVFVLNDFNADGEQVTRFTLTEDEESKVVAILWVKPDWNKVYEQRVERAKAIMASVSNAANEIMLSFAPKPKHKKGDSGGNWSTGKVDRDSAEYKSSIAQARKVWEDIQAAKRNMFRYGQYISNVKI